MGCNDQPGEDYHSIMRERAARESQVTRPAARAAAFAGTKDEEDEEDELTSSLDPVTEVQEMHRRLTLLVEALEQRREKAAHELRRVDVALAERRAQRDLLFDLGEKLLALDSAGGPEPADDDVARIVNRLVGRGDRE